MLFAMGPGWNQRRKKSAEKREQKIGKTLGTMLYAIIAVDAPQSLDRRLQARPEHIKRLQMLAQEGRVVLAGPHPAVDADDPGPAGFSGSLIVAEFDSQQDAQDWADADPYVEAGVFADVKVKPFKQVMP